MNAADFHTARQALGLTQAQLAEAIGISPRMLRYYESGDRKIPLTVALAVKAYATLKKEVVKPYPFMIFDEASTISDNIEEIMLMAHIRVYMAFAEMRALRTALSLAEADIESLSSGGDEGRGYFANQREIKSALNAIGKVYLALNAEIRDEEEKLRKLNEVTLKLASNHPE